jgi:hypothetical protein
VNTDVLIRFSTERVVLACCIQRLQASISELALAAPFNGMFSFTLETSGVNGKNVRTVHKGTRLERQNSSDTG